MKKFLLAAPLALVLAACVTPTVYGPAGKGGVGFVEQRITAERWRVSFRGGGGAPAGQVSDYALLRAAELTLANGYDWFRVENRYVEQTGYQGTSLGVGVGGASYGRHTGVGLGVSSGVPLNGGPQLTSTLDISMGKGPRPNDANVYDARDVQQHVGPRS